MPTTKIITKKIILTATDRKQVRQIASKTKLTEEKVIEQAIHVVQPLLKLISKAKRTRK